MTSSRRTIAMTLRIIAGAILVAMAARYGALSRSPWTIAYAAVALSVAMALTRKNFWRKPTVPDRFWLSKRLAATAISETVLATSLFLLAYAVSWAVGAAQPLAPLHEQDFDYALMALVLALLTFGVATLLEDGKDPIDAALEDFEMSMERHRGHGVGMTSPPETGQPPHVSDIERVEEPAREDVQR